MRTRSGRLGLAMVAAAIVVGASSPVAAKGVEAVTIASAGMTDPVELGFSGDDGLSRLLRLTRVIDIAVVATDHRERGIAPPPHAHELGRVVRVRWDLFCCPPGGTDEPIVQLVYPEAPDGPLVHTPGGQRPYGREPATESVWIRAETELVRLLAELGVPVTAVTPAARSAAFAR